MSPETITSHFCGVVCLQELIGERWPYERAVSCLLKASSGEEQFQIRKAINLTSLVMTLFSSLACSVQEKGKVC